MNRWIVLSFVFVLGGCLSKVDREAISFPAMPSQAVYHRMDGKQLSPDDTIDALQSAESTCRNQNGNGSTPSIVGTPAFDACMRTQGYQRAP